MNDNEYLVLARKYRPLTFDDLVGQEALVKTVSNAIMTKRIPHAYLLTGIRGIGKTTSARIIARTLNCNGEDGKGTEIPLKPCGKCSHCKAIIESRDIDVVEIDAASNTGVDNIRELIEGAKYTPVSARFKIYIIDEVHMLSKSAFNALLKTLEEPPEHVKFIFATTEVRKIPVTILSRCQRFDLKRLSLEVMAKFLGEIAKKEQIEISLEALNILSMMSEGSARDGTSLLDQAIAHSGKKIGEEDVRKMLGLADKSETMGLFYEIMAGNVENVLKNITEQYENGVEPEIMLNDLMEINHIVTKIKVGGVIPEKLYTADFVAKAKEFAKNLNMASLTLVWQMLIKGLGEVSSSPFPFKSLEMLLIRVCYATGIPDFRELLKKNSKLDANITAEVKSIPMPEVVAINAPLQSPVSNYGANKGANPVSSKNNDELNMIKTPFDIYKMAEKHMEPELAYNIKTYLCPIDIKKGKIKIADKNAKTGELKVILERKLAEWTGENWEIEIVADETNRAKSVVECHTQGKDYFKEKVLEHPMVKEINALFETEGVSRVDILSGEKDEGEDEKDEELYHLSENLIAED